jgi:hypothetical protein
MIYPHIPCDQIIIDLHECIAPNNNRDFLYTVVRKGIYHNMRDTFFDIKAYAPNHLRITAIIRNILIYSGLVVKNRRHNKPHKK